jgi:hypothetical protein
MIKITKETFLTWLRVLIGVASVVVGTVVIAFVVGASVGNLFAVGHLRISTKRLSWNELYVSSQGMLEAI